MRVSVKHQDVLISFALSSYLFLFWVPRVCQNPTKDIERWLPTTPIPRFDSVFVPNDYCKEIAFHSCSLLSSNNRSLSFLDAPSVVFGRPPHVIDVTVLSPGSGCRDIIEAVFTRTDLATEQRLFLGQVKPMGEDKYKILGAIYEPGQWKLKVRTIWQNYSPLSTCREERICWQEEQPWKSSTMNSLMTELPITILSPLKSKLHLAAKEAVPVNEPDRPCERMEELMDGSWVQGSASTLRHFENFKDVLVKGKVDEITNKTLGFSNATWSPNSCYLQAYNATYLRTLFRGKHIHFCGDSTMHEILRMALALFGFTSPNFPVAGPCDYRNRIFDSGSEYPVRFSFAWAGGPEPCDNYKGVKSLITSPGKETFLDRYKADADFILVNVGLHDKCANIPIESYVADLRTFLGMITGVQPANRARTPSMWLSTNPETHHNGICPSDTHNDGNGGLLWMNAMANEIAHNFSFVVMDSYRLVQGAYLAYNPQNEIQCGDGHHCIGCDACWAKVLIIVQNLVSQLHGYSIKNTQPSKRRMG